jgi:hypothetical protein
VAGLPGFDKKISFFDGAQLRELQQDQPLFVCQLRNVIMIQNLFGPFDDL